MTGTEVSRIKIGKHTFGIVGLKKTLEDVANPYANQPDDKVAGVLLKRLSLKIYIPQKVLLWETALNAAAEPVLSLKVENLLSSYMVPMVVQ